MFDKFFDCMNTRNLDEGMRKLKPDLNGYFSEKDSRLKVLLKQHYSVHHFHFINSG